MNDFDNVITPGVERLVAFLNEKGFKTTDSGDGVSNQELNMVCSMDCPNVFFDMEDLTTTQSLKVIDDVCKLMRDLGVVFGGKTEESPVLGLSYDPTQSEPGTCMGYLFNVDDAMIWGVDPELPRKRLEYQIRYCDNWIADPPTQKMLDAGESLEDVAAAVQDYTEMREEFKECLSNLPHINH